MLYSLKLPKIMPAMSTAMIELIYVNVGDALKPGDKLLDITVDLGSSFSQNCPPISHYRIVAREKALVRRLLVAAGADCEAGAPLAIVGTDAAEPDDLEATRPLRIAVAGILRHAGMWSMSHSS